MSAKRKWKLVPVEATQKMRTAGKLMRHEYAAMLAAAPEPEPCVWTKENDGLWEVGCNKFALFDTYPSFNEMKFCCYCGHPLEVRENE